MYLARSDSSFDGAVGDFNGDGIDDIFVANRDQQNEVLLADGQGDFTSTLLARSDSSYGGVVGDFNGDGIDDIFVANRGQHNEYLWYDPCSDDGFFYDAPTRGCYACPRYTTDTRHSVSRCEACPAGTIGPGQALKHDQRFFCIPCEAGKTRALETNRVCIVPSRKVRGQWRAVVRAMPSSACHKCRGRRRDRMHRLLIGESAERGHEWLRRLHAWARRTRSLVMNARNAMTLSGQTLRAASLAKRARGRTPPAPCASRARARSTASLASARSARSRMS